MPRPLRFVGIVEQGTEDLLARRRLFEEACSTREIEAIFLDPRSVDHLALPTLGRGDLLYNLGRGGTTLEGLLFRPEVATFYDDPSYVNWAQMTTVWTLVHERIGLPAPRTIHDVTRDRGKLDRYAAHVGGYPLVVKIDGGTRGIGVLKVDSREGFYSLMDHLASQGTRAAIRQFIDTGAALRLVVIGERVVATVRYLAPPGDFRSAIAERPAAEPAQATAAQEATAVAAVRAIGLEMGGVDLVVDNAGSHYLLEVNFPFSPQTPQRVTGLDVVGMLVDWLAAKARRRLADAGR